MRRRRRMENGGTGEVRHATGCREAVCAGLQHRTPARPKRARCAQRRPRSHAVDGRYWIWFCELTQLKALTHLPPLPALAAERLALLLEHGNARLRLWREPLDHRLHDGVLVVQTLLEADRWPPSSAPRCASRQRRRSSRRRRAASRRRCPVHCERCVAVEAAADATEMDAAAVPVAVLVRREVAAAAAAERLAAA